MGFAVEMYFDRRMESELRELRAILAREGIPPVLDELGDRPHVSLSVHSELNVEAFTPYLAKFAAGHKAFSVGLELIGTFPKVMFLRPAVTAELIAIHSDFHRVAAGMQIRSVDHYLPQNWVPHCTIAQDVEGEMMTTAVETCRRYIQPMSGSICEMGVVEFRPVVSWGCFPLVAPD